MRRRSSFRNRFEYLLTRAVLATLARTPLGLAGVLARCYVRLLDRAVPRLRRTALRNLELAFPEATASRRAEIANGVFASLARLMVVFSRFPQIRRDNVKDWIRYEGFEQFKAALARGKGVLFATAHLGAWELSAFAHAWMAAPMHVVVRPLDNPLLDAFVERYRSLSGNRLIGKKEFARSILRALAANEAVGILVDQNVGLEDAVFVDFFGVPAASGAAFARIAARTGAAVIPGFAVWSEPEGRYILRFYPPVEITGDLRADTERVQAAIEAAIREYPDQWLWIHRRWKTRPPGCVPLY